MYNGLSLYITDTQNVLAMIEEFEKKCNQYHSWLSEAKKVKEDCGPIGADLERLQEQEVILEVSIPPFVWGQLSFHSNYEYH